MYTFVCTYICIYVYMNIFIYTYIYAKLIMFYPYFFGMWSPNMYICIRVYIYMYIHTYININMSPAAKTRLVWIIYISI